MSLSDKVAIVTGAARGIGRTFSLALAREGATVVAADIGDAGPVAKEIEALGGRAKDVRCDVTSAEQTQACAKEAVDSYGRIDILVNNAAIYGGLRPNMLEMIPEAEWDRVMAVNIRGAWLMSAAVIPTMKSQQYGRVVNMSSGVAFQGPPFFLQYVTSKAALIGMTRGMAREVGMFGVTVNAITPGVIWTEATEDVVGGMGLAREAFMETVLPGMSIKRAQEPEDLVPALLFLVSDAAGMVTGQAVNVDGGIIFH